MNEEFSIPNEEYETQFFGFSPSDIFEGVQSLINYRFEDAINKFEKQMQKIPPSVLPKDELKEGINRLQSSTQLNINDTLVKLKKHLLQNIIKVPPNLLLIEDAEQSDQISDEEYRTLKEEIEKLKTELKEEKFMEAVLKEELKDIDAVRQAQKTFLETELSPSVQSLFEDEKDQLTFLAANVCQIEDAVQSVQQSHQFAGGDSLAKHTFEEHMMH